MNRIEAIRAPSKFVAEPHLIIAVDGVPLDELLDTARPELQLAGLVSSLLGWFHNEEDSVVAWQRILPEAGCTAYAPILICPDELDYSCSVIVAEVVAELDVIRWDRLGFDATRRGAVGSCVRWEPGLGPFQFSRLEYEACLSVFRAADNVAVVGVEQNRTSGRPKQIVISEPLWSFMEYCEVYCSGACCGVQAFEAHPALLLRKVIDMNLATKDGSASFQAARHQMTELRQRVSSEPLQTVNDEVPFWKGETSELPQFLLPVEEVADWLVKWETCFTKASQYGGLEESAV